MRSSEPQSVVEVTVDALGVVAPLVERLEVRITRRDLTDVLGPVELPLPILVVRVQPDGDGAATEAFGQSVVVVPAIGAALVRIAVSADPLERYEDRLAGLGGLAKPRSDRLQ